MRKLLTLILILVILISACSSEKEYQTYSFDYFYFDTIIKINIYSDIEIDESEVNSDLDAILKDYELTFSPTNESSLTYQLNDKKKITANEEMIDLTNKSIETCEATNGILDITSGELIDIWSINNENNIPSQKQIDAALKTVACDNVIVDGNEISVINGAKVDYGSVTKGYVANDLEKYLRDNSYNNALINLGGNIQLVNDKPDGSSFKIGVMKPEIDNSTNEDVLLIKEVDQAVVTSGINQRFFVGDDGQIYHHILDLSTGKPADNNLASVTIITEDGYTADSLSTTVFIMGLEEGQDYINSLPDVEAIFITRDKEIYSTDHDLSIELQDNDYKIIE